MSQSVNFPWLNAKYFQEVLSKAFKNSSIKVTDIKIEPCGAADGFLSTLLRVGLKFVLNSKEESESFVVKMMTNEELAIEKVGAKGYDVQKKEMMFFELVAPQIEKLMKKFCDEENIFAKAIVVDREHEVILMEDLKVKGFIMTDRFNGLDEVHVKMSLEKLAKFHAASLILHKKHPKIFDSFDIGMFSRKIDAFNDAFLSIFEAVVEEIQTWPGFEEYAGKLDKIRGHLIENATRCFDNDPGDLCVLNHGDVWTNNFMFAYDDSDKVQKAILIDFQFCHWASPALDLIHFLYTSLNDELYSQHQIESFVQLFYYELKKNLIKLDYDFSNFPSLHEFQLQMLKKSFYAFVFTLTVYPIMTSDDADNDFIAHHSRDERATNFKRRMLKAPKYQSLVRKMLPVYDRMGLLDVPSSQNAV